MMLGLSLLVGIREQLLLSAIWMLMWTTMMLGLLTEMWSRPHQNKDGSYDMTRWSGDLEPVRPGVPWFKLELEERCQRAMQQSVRRYNYLLRMIPHILGTLSPVAFALHTHPSLPCPTSLEQLDAILRPLFC